jgi:hypothetical protein
MYTDPQIFIPNDTVYRSYVKVTVNGNRYRFYNGNKLGISCFPNNTKNHIEKLRLLSELQYELKKKLEASGGRNTRHSE